MGDQAAKVIAAQNALGVRWNDWTKDCVTGFPIEVYRHGDGDDFEVIARYPGQHERDGDAYLQQHREQVLQAALDAAEARAVGVPDDASDYAAARKYAAYLAQSLREQHYPNNTTWQPMPDLLGLLTQIDNMVAGALHPASPLGAVVMREKAAEVMDTHNGAPCPPPDRWPKRDADLYVSAQMDASDSWKYAIRALPTTFTDAELLAAAAEALTDLLHKRGGYHKCMTQADVDGLWDAVKEESGFAAVSAFLAALAPFARKGGQ